MLKSLQINIPEPCHENWHNMTPQDQGRFCGSCQKVVVDFSLMTDKEVLNYFSKSTRPVCGRFSNDQLNRELIIEPPKKRFTMMYVWNVLLASLLLTKTYAQGKPQVKKTVQPGIEVMRLKNGISFKKTDTRAAVIPVKITGVILDLQTGEPVIGASITLKGVSGGKMADSLGHFTFHVKRRGVLELEFSAIGYETQMLVIDKSTNWKNIKVLMKPAIDSLEQVTVTSYPAMVKKTYTTGPVSITASAVKPDSVISCLIDRWGPTALRKEVKVYPNPVMRGSVVKVSVVLQQAGDYKLELLNTSGQVMLVMPLLFSTKEQQIDVHTQSNWSAGIYWIRISTMAANNVYQGKVLLQ
jgi:hypothetical protein